MQVLENREQWAEGFRKGWLAHCQESGETDWQRYECPRNSTAPAGTGIDLGISRLMLVSSAGGYLPDRHEPFDAGNPFGDYSVRLFPSTTPLDALEFAHEHYDHAAVNEDPQVLVPLRLLEDLVSDDVVGELAPSVVSFMGYQPDVVRVVDETLPAMLQAAQAEGVDAALLVPG